MTFAGGTSTYTDSFESARHAAEAGPATLRKMLAMQRPGQCACQTLRQCVECDDLILQYAAKHGLPVRLLCGSVHGLLRETLWRETNGVTFADRVSRIINSEAHVDVVVWDELTPERLAPDLLQLVRDIVGGSAPAALRLFASGTREGHAELVHFLLAGSPDDPRSVLRVELEHPPFKLWAASIEPDRAHECAVLFGTKDCREKGQLLADVFDTIVQSIVGR